MKKITNVLLLLALCLNLTSGIMVRAQEVAPTIEYEYQHRNVYYEDETIPQSIVVSKIVDPQMSTEDIELIALVTMAEAEGECEEGKRLVIDTILNRMDSEHFPDTIYDVIYQPHQFSSMWNGRVDRCEVRTDIVELVKEELVNRTNYEVVFFTAGRYSKYGTPMFNVEHHYFSKYN